MTATVAALCQITSCDAGYAVEIDGTIVPGAEVVMPTLFTVDADPRRTHDQLTAGSHRIELVSSTPSADEVVKLSGVLIQ